MNIHYRIQDKFSADQSPLWILLPDKSKRDTSFIEIELILKDIRFIRHELSNYSYLYASQLSFDGHLNKKYWEFLALKGKVAQADKDELEEGVLLIIYLWYTQIYEGQGESFLYRNKLFETVNSFISSYKSDNGKKKKLRKCIQFSMEHHNNEAVGDQYNAMREKNDHQLREKLMANDKWVYKTFVEDYFIDIANSFEPLRKQTRDFHEAIRRNAGKKQ